MSNKTDVNEVIQALGAGVVMAQLETLLSSCASGVMHNGDGKKKGKITLELQLCKIGDSISQMAIASKVSHVTPTGNGKKSEESTSETVMYVGKGGRITENPPKEEDSGQYRLDSQADTPKSVVRLQK